MPRERVLDSLWRSEIGRHNATVVQAKYRDLLEALVEVDQLGHRVQERISRQPIESDERWLGVVLLRRVMLHFCAIRHLLEASCVDGAKLPARALFETTLQVRYAVFGGARPIKLDVTPTTRRAREIRARYYRAAGIREEIYRHRALLSGSMGLRRPPKEVRRQLKGRIQEDLDQLAKRYPTQQANFGSIKDNYDRRKWYSFGFRKNPPNSVRALAKRLGRLDEYSMLYQTFSGLVHPSRLGFDTSLKDGDMLGILSPYNPESIGVVFFFCTTWQLRALSYLARAQDEGSVEDVRNVRTKIAPMFPDLEDDVTPEFFGEEPRIMAD